MHDIWSIGVIPVHPKVQGFRNSGEAYKSFDRTLESWSKSILGTKSGFLSYFVGRNHVKFSSKSHSKYTLFLGSDTNLG